MSDPQVLAAWSGLRLTEVRELTPGRVWELADKRGSRYALKPVFDQPWLDATSRFVAEARIVSFLARRGLPVAPPVLCDDGRIYATDDADVAYFLTPMLPAGRAGEVESADRFRDVGATLARLHVALAECPFEIHSWEINAASFTSVWERIKAEVADIDELVALVEPWLDRIAIATDDSRRQLVHGDAHGANILTNEDSVTGIIDIEHMPIAPRTYDVAYFFTFGINWPYKNDRVPVVDDIALMVRNVLDGYGTLTAAELDQIPALSLSVALGLLNYFRDDERRIQEWWIDTARWIIEHPQTLMR
jgi:Ser/Thr protein kinase RdoA (MazF antagonist)